MFYSINVYFWNFCLSNTVWLMIYKCKYCFLRKRGNSIHYGSYLHSYTKLASKLHLSYDLSNVTFTCTMTTGSQILKCIETWHWLKSNRNTEMEILNLPVNMSKPMNIWVFYKRNSAYPLPLHHTHTCTIWHHSRYTYNFKKRFTCQLLIAL